MKEGVYYRSRAGEPYKTVGVRMPISFIQELETLAAEKRMSMSYLCEELIRIGIEECRPPAHITDRTPLTQTDEDSQAADSSD